jgi:glycosyltransferase involved in cell wall biosynthesis
MRVAISGFFWPQPHVGSGQYLHQLVGQLAASRDVRPLLLRPALGEPGPTPPAGGASLALATPFDPIARAGGRSGRLARNLAKIYFEQIALPQAAWSLRAELLHVPYFAPPLRARCPVVATVHDLVPLLLPQYRGSAPVRAYMRLARRATAAATQLIADSEATRCDVLRHLGVDPARVSTVYLAHDPRYRPLPAAEAAAQLARLGIPQPFVYYVGGFDARKNLETLLRAFAAARPRLAPQLRMVLAGRIRPPDGLLFPDLCGQIAALGLADRVILPGFVSDADNRALYSACAAFAFPSRYEGFGLPPLEALACGAPVLCADTSSLPEVVGDAATLLPPDDVDAWAEALVRVVAAPPPPARGLAQAARFSVARMAEETQAVYRRALGSRAKRP